MIAPSAAKPIPKQRNKAAPSRKLLSSCSYYIYTRAQCQTASATRSGLAAKQPRMWGSPCSVYFLCAKAWKAPRSPVFRHPQCQQSFGLFVVVASLPGRLALAGHLPFTLRPCLVPHQKNFHPSHRIFGHMHGTLNVDKKIN